MKCSKCGNEKENYIVDCDNFYSCLECGHSFLKEKFIPGKETKRESLIRVIEMIRTHLLCIYA